MSGSHSHARSVASSSTAIGTVGFVGTCARADGKDVALWLVENGQAMDWPMYSSGKYASAQERAKTAKVGIWQGSSQPPWEWRQSGREHHNAPEAPQASSESQRREWPEQPEPVGGLY